MKVSLLRRHRHICEMRRLQAATFLSLPVGLSVGLETPAGCWASPIPPQLLLLGRVDPWARGRAACGERRAWLDPDPSCKVRNWRNLWLWRAWCCLCLAGLAHGADCGVVIPDTQGRFLLGFTQVMPSHGPERSGERSSTVGSCTWSVIEIIAFISHLCYWSFSAMSWFSWADPPV